MKNYLILLVILIALGATGYLLFGAHGGNQRAESSPSPSTPSESPASSSITAINVALLAGPKTDEDLKHLQGCDLVVMQERAIPPTQAPLTMALRELFARKEPWPYSDVRPGNFISSQKNLFFKSVSIEDGIANVQLTGSYSLSGECDDPRIETQIRETAKQFPTVHDVRIFLNGAAFSIPSLKGE